jgi:hypothetical protein
MLMVSISRAVNPEKVSVICWARNHASIIGVPSVIAAPAVFQVVVDVRESVKPVAARAKPDRLREVPAVAPALERDRVDA